MTKKINLIALSAVILISLILFCQAGLNSSSSKSGLEFKTKNPEVENIKGLQNVLEIQNLFRQIANTVMPAVVSIHVESEVKVRNPQHEFFGNDPFFRRFFGLPEEELKRRIQGQGSGTIVTPDGYVFSNNHVIDGAQKITVKLLDDRTFEAEVVGTDPETDIAILKIDGENLPYAALGDPTLSEVGDWVISIGNPFGLEGTYTFGTISAIGRPGMMSGFQQFIQTDTAVNPGNSGGPLVNMRGQVIGINTAIHSRTGGYMGISFAVPIDIARDVATQILETGRVVRGYLGIVPGNLDDTSRRNLKLKDDEGVLVSEVVEGGPADKAGIQMGDIVTKINNVPVNRPDRLQRQIGSISPGENVRIEILRQGKRKTIDVTLLARPVGEEWKKDQAPERRPESPDKPAAEVSFNGALFQEPSEEYLKRHRAKYGVVVSSVERGSNFAGVLRRGEIVVGINETTIRNIDDMKKFAEDNRKTGSFTFMIVTNGRMIYRSIDR